MYIRACICNFSIFFFLIFISSRSKVEIFSFTYKITTKRNVFFERDRFWKPFIVGQKLTRFELRTGKVYQERGTKKRNGTRREGKREKKGEGRKEREKE